MYEVFNLLTNKSHGTFDTLEQANGCVSFDRLTHYSIWNGSVKVA